MVVVVRSVAVRVAPGLRSVGARHAVKFVVCAMVAFISLK